jgi:hypothetical protein
MVERFSPLVRGPDENLEIGDDFFLSDEFGEGTRSQALVEGLFALQGDWICNLFRSSMPLKVRVASTVLNACKVFFGRDSDSVCVFSPLPAPVPAVPGRHQARATSSIGDCRAAALSACISASRFFPGRERAAQPFSSGHRQWPGHCSAPSEIRRTQSPTGSCVLGTYTETEMSRKQLPLGLGGEPS